MLWLFAVASEFIDAVARGDRGLWPFILSVVMITALAVAFDVWQR